MLKTLRNLAIIFFISFIAAGITINMSPLIGENSFIQVDKKYKPLVTISTDAENYLFNPTTISVKHQAIDDANLNFYDDYLINIMIYKGNKIFNTYNQIELAKEKPYILQLTKNTPHKVNIDISQKKLKLPNGKYRIVISSNAMELKYSISPITLNVEYIGNAPYYPAVYEVPEGKMPLTLYFPDNEYKISQLIGVTRFVETNSNPYNTVVRELQKGPAINMGLSTFSPIGNVDYAVLQNSTLYINLPRDEEIYNNDKSQFAMNSFLKSMFDLPRVARIKFLVNNQKVSTFFNDVDIHGFFEKNNENKAYLAFNSFKRYFLVDCDVETITDKDLPKEKIEKVLDALKNSENLYLSNTIPDDVEIIDYYIQDKTISLNFGKSILKSYNENKSLQRMMLDSILFSLTSIEGIENVQILVEGESIDTFAGIDISTPLTRPTFINPEIVN